MNLQTYDFNVKSISQLLQDLLSMIIAIHRMKCLPSTIKVSPIRISTECSQVSIVILSFMSLCLDTPTQII